MFFIHNSKGDLLVIWERDNFSFLAFYKFFFSFCFWIKSVLNKMPNSFKYHYFFLQRFLSVSFQRQGSSAHWTDCCDWPLGLGQVCSGFTFYTILLCRSSQLCEKKLIILMYTEWYSSDVSNFCETSQLIKNKRNIDSNHKLSKIKG